MKYTMTILMLFLAGLITLVQAPNAQAQDNTASLQIIHNSADPLVSSVDIYVNGDLAVPALGFREATGFIELDSDLTYDIVVTPAGADPEDGFSFEGITLDADEFYYVVATGLATPGDFAPNPDEVETGFFLDIIPGAALEAESETNVDLKVYHGATDAPAVDVLVRNVGPLVENVAFTDFTPEYLNVIPGDYILDVNVAGSETTAASFAVDLSALGGGTAIALASGFLNPAENQDGEGFAIIAVLADGTVVTFEPLVEEFAQVQIIHNSADPAVAEVDIYINGDLAFGEVPFRAATPFTELAAGVAYDIVVTPAGADPEDGFSFEGITLEANENYYVVATGLATPGDFADNPSGVETGFFLDIIPGAKLAADDEANVEFKIYHGATDAPAVDVIARDVATLAENVAYTGFTPEYLAVPAAPYTIDVNVAGTETTAASFGLDLSALGGGTAIVLASGFLNPADNQNGEGFALIAALGDGTVVVFEPVTEEETAFVQIIHNSADPAVAEVDIYIDGVLAFGEVPFRAATPFTELAAGVAYDIVVTPAGADPEDGFSFEGITLEANENYYVVATGLATPGDFADNPSGVETGFFLDIIPGAKLAADDEGTVEFKIYHGATDAPAVDVIARNVAPLAENVSYTDFTPEYLGVPADAYTIDVNVAGTETTAASFDLDLSMLGGGTAIVLASGFLSPEVNQNGEAFALVAVLGDGTVVVVEPTTNIGDPGADLPAVFQLNQNYPNPFNPTTNITYSLPEAANVTLEVFNLQGQRVAVLVNGQQSAGTYTATFDGGRLASGVYLYRLQAGSFSQVQKMMLVK